MKKFVLVCLLGMLACILFGCSQNERAPVESFDVSISTTVSVVKLADGTRCAVMETMKGGGIDCDWRASPGVE